MAGSNSTSYTVTVNTGSGSGSLGLQLTGTNVHDSSGYYVGPFQSETQMSGPRFSIINTAAVGDINGDGKQDMVYIRTVSASAYFLDVRNNDGTGPVHANLADRRLGAGIVRINSATSTATASWTS